MLQYSHGVFLRVLSRRDLQLSVILETVEATSNGLASNFRDRASLLLNLVGCFFFTEFYLASWPRHPKWKVPWMHRLGSSLRNDNSEAGWKPVTASPCTVYRQHETKVHVILQYLCETRCLHLLKMHACAATQPCTLTLHAHNEPHSVGWNINILSDTWLMFFDSCPVASSKVGSWHLPSKFQN